MAAGMVVPIDGAPAASSQRRATRLILLCGFALLVDGREVALPRSIQRLLAYLALQERPVERNQLAGLLWPDHDEARSAANLRSGLWRLHLVGCRLVEATAGRLRLAPWVSVDVRETVALSRRLLDRRPGGDAADLDETPLVGDLLPGWADDWVLVEREHLRQLQLHALEALSGLMVSAGRVGRAVELALAAVAIDPLRESAHGALISAYLAEGNRAVAVRQFEACRSVLRQELGLEPTAELRQLLLSPC